MNLMSIIFHYSVCVCVCICTHAIFLRWNLSLNMKLTDLMGLANQWVPGIFLPALLFLIYIWVLAITWIFMLTQWAVYWLSQLPRQTLDLHPCTYTLIVKHNITCLSVSRINFFNHALFFSEPNSLVCYITIVIKISAFR